MRNELIERLRRYRGGDCKYRALMDEAAAALEAAYDTDDRIKELTAEREQIIDAATKRIMQIEDQRDKARRELRTARSILSDLTSAFTADFEDSDGAAGLEYKGKAYRRALRFLGETSGRKNTRTALKGDA